MATSTLFAPEFVIQLFQQMQSQAESSTSKVLGGITKSIWSLIQPYWVYIAIGFFVLLIFLTLKAMLGEWGELGSFLYHVFYFGFLGVVIAFKGWGIIFNPLFDLIAWIFYRVSYWITGLILDKVKNRI